MKRIALLLLIGCAPAPAESVPLLDSGWESIGNYCERLEVPGGWIVLFNSIEKGGVTFVPDAEKEWKK